MKTEASLLRGFESPTAQALIYLIVLRRLGRVDILMLLIRQTL